MSAGLLWALSALLIVVGVAGTVLPALPGTAFVLGGIVLGAWIDDFTRVPVWVVVLCTVLAVLAWVLDYVAGLMGARRAGASKQALIGAAVLVPMLAFSGRLGSLRDRIVCRIRNSSGRAACPGSSGEPQRPCGGASSGSRCRRA